MCSLFVGFNRDASIPIYTYKITRQLRIVHSPYDLFVFIKFLKYSSDDRIFVVALKQQIK